MTQDIRSGEAGPEPGQRSDDGKPGSGLEAVPDGDRYEPEQEIRLAVVMYGGVSLAIYMNGVAQELYHLVRATAPSAGAAAPSTALHVPADKLTGTERVYRKLGGMLGRVPRAEGNGEGQVRTRFVVDILSGTSAGGINGVFLAKALSNQEPMDGLTRLWVDEGDLATLLNDGLSCKGEDRRWCPGREPASLLNSRRILGLLMRALRSMEQAAGPTGPHQCSSPYVQNLDLYVTATDVAGLTLPIRLADKLVYERRYRTVFHFRYGFQDADGRPYNDFHAGNTPFLAFAARSTSAFPFAFEPVSLEAAMALSGTAPAPAEWTNFYSDYLRAQPPSRPALPFAGRWFIDGGCLDNKPFAPAVDALRWRQADVPVRRMLFYVEPTPEHPERRSDSAAEPDALETVFSGYVDLPRFEAIRTEIERLTARNAIIRRIKAGIGEIEPDHQALSTEARTAEWLRTPVRDVVRNRGMAYGAYHRLKVAAVTASLSDIIGCAAGLDPDSSENVAVRYLVEAWRAANFDEPETGDPCHPPHTSTRFLLLYDLDYRIRRLSFIRSKLDSLFASAPEQRDRLREAKLAVNNVRWSLLRTHAWLSAPDSERNPLRRALDDLLDDIARAGRFSGSAAEARSSAIAALLTPILQPGDGRTSATEAASAYARHKEPFDHIGDVLADALEHGFAPSDASQNRQDRLGFRPASEAALGILAGLEELKDDCGFTLRAYYEGYDSFDAITFPILYGTDVGELKEVEIVRVSPEDAARLRNEEHDSRGKLAGASFGHFGGFFDRRWRENDILWGRLDGVERIIDGVARELPQVTRDSLVAEAQEAILAETFPGTDAHALYQAARAAQTNPQPPQAEAAQPGADTPPPLTPERFVATVAYGAEKGLGGLPPSATVRLAARASRVLGLMLEGISWRRGLKQTWISIPARVGAIACAVVEIAMPGSLLHLLARHWFKLLYLLELLLIVGGSLAGAAGIQKFGWQALWVTLGLQIGVFLLETWLQGSKGLRALKHWFAVVIVALAIAIGYCGLRDVASSAAQGGSWIAHQVRRLAGVSQ